MTWTLDVQFYLDVLRLFFFPKSKNPIFLSFLKTFLFDEKLARFWKQFVKTFPTIKLQNQSNFVSDTDRKNSGISSEGSSVLQFHCNKNKATYFWDTNLHKLCTVQHKAQLTCISKNFKKNSLSLGMFLEWVCPFGSHCAATCLQLRAGSLEPVSRRRRVHPSHCTLPVFLLHCTMVLYALTFSAKRKTKKAQLDSLRAKCNLYFLL